MNDGIFRFFFSISFRFSSFSVWNYLSVCSVKVDIYKKVRKYLKIDIKDIVNGRDGVKSKYL